MHFNQEPVRARCDGGLCHRRHQGPLARGVTGINDDRQMGQGLQCGDGCQVERVPVLRFEGPNASLAQHHVLVPTRHDVFRREQPFLDGCRESPFQEYRLVVRADLFQQLEVLHVPGADLDDVRLLEKQFDVPRVEDLAHDRKLREFLGFPEEIQALIAESLKRIGR